VAAIKVMVADENDIFREGLARLLEDQEGIEVVSRSSGGREIIEQVEKTAPEVVLMGSDILERDSIDVTSEICKAFPEVRVAVFTGLKSEEHACAVMEAGAAGYLSKEMNVDDLVKSIDLINKGQVIVSPPLAAKLAGKLTSLRASEDTGKTALSEREVEVLKLMAGGYTNKEIAGKLFVTENTARVHIKNILSKLNLRNRQQAAAYAMQQGLISEIGDQ
jgi:DNA-binding NarL/FixJ family response regulator